MRAVNCVKAMIIRPRKPRIQPAVVAVENSLFMSDNVLSMPYTSLKRVYYDMFQRVLKVVSFGKKMYQYRTFLRVMVLQIRCSGS